jgi:hypothetical protein
VIVIHYITMKIWYYLGVESSDMKKNIVVKKVKDDTSDAKYWSKQSIEKRIQALEEIRTEYNQWKYGAQSRLQRVYRVVKSS